MASRVFAKRRADAPGGFFEAEAAGLRWLADAGGAPVVEVLGVAADRIELVAIEHAAPDPTVAEAFGAALAATHAAGADAFGVPPAGYDGPTFIGNQPLTTRRAGWPSWGEFFAEERVLPYARLAADRGHIDGPVLTAVERACERIAAGVFDDDEAPARIHGDLWNGNVQWSVGAAVLIDPAAHGGHRETDLAMLALFGCPFLREIVAGYERVRPMRSGWRDRVPVHQLHPLAVHAASHGSAYATPLLQAAAAVGG